VLSFFIRVVQFYQRIKNPLDQLMRFDNLGNLVKRWRFAMARPVFASRSTSAPRLAALRELTAGQVCRGGVKLAQDGGQPAALFIRVILNIENQSLARRGRLEPPREACQAPGTRPRRRQRAFAYATGTAQHRDGTAQRMTWR